LTLHRIVAENIATGIPYPKIEKTVPQFLTINEIPYPKIKKQMETNGITS
jgi:hypothetical protein